MWVEPHDNYKHLSNTTATCSCIFLAIVFTFLFTGTEHHQINLLYDKSMFFRKRNVFTQCSYHQVSIRLYQCVKTIVHDFKVDIVFISHFLKSILYSLFWYIKTVCKKFDFIFTKKKVSKIPYVQFQKTQLYDKVSRHICFCDVQLI